MLTERQELILKTIIMDFTQTHEPVGSKTVMNQLPIKVSSATIRNEMAVPHMSGINQKCRLILALCLLFSCSLILQTHNHTAPSCIHMKRISELHRYFLAHDLLSTPP